MGGILEGVNLIMVHRKIPLEKLSMPWFTLVIDQLYMKLSHFETNQRVVYFWRWMKFQGDLMLKRKMIMGNKSNSGNLNYLNWLQIRRKKKSKLSLKERIFYCPKNLNSDYEKLEPHLPTCMLTLFVIHMQMIKGWKNTVSGEGSANHIYPLIILFLSSKNTCKLMRTIVLLYNLHQ